MDGGLERARGRRELEGEVSFVEGSLLLLLGQK